MELSTYLHFANNENIVTHGQPEYDQVAKVRPVITALQKLFLYLYFDNFFSSVSLLNNLLKDELYACGTFCKDRRGLPQAIVKTTLGRWIINIYTLILDRCM